jgi:hypothetical protein
MQFKELAVGDVFEFTGEYAEPGKWVKTSLALRMRHDRSVTAYHTAPEAEVRRVSEVSYA